MLGFGYNTRVVYDAYRDGYMAAGRGIPGPDRFGYLGLVAVGHNEQQARERAEQIAAYFRTSDIVAPAFRNPPGYLSPEDNARLLKGQAPPRGKTKDGRGIAMNKASVVKWRLAAAKDKNIKNPALGTIERAPFYGVKLLPSIGGSAGLLTNRHAQVMHLRERPIPGLYATGIVAVRDEGGVGYQAGATLAAAMTFSYLAVKHMTKQ